MQKSPNYTGLMLAIAFSSLLGILFYFFIPSKVKNRVALPTSGTNNRSPASFQKRESPFLHAKLQIEAKQITKQFPHLRRRINQVSGIISSTSNVGELPAGLSLTVITDTECLEKNSTNTPLLPRLRAHHQLKVEAIPVNLPQNTDPSRLEEDLLREPCIVGISTDGEVKMSNTFYTDPQIASQNQLSAIRAASVEQFFYFSSLIPSTPTVVAIIDTGIDYNHSDLAANMWRNPNGQFGYDFINGDFDPFDDNGHGTHVAGIAGAVGNNGIGGSGVLGKNIQLMAVKVLDEDGVGSWSAVTNAIRYATDNGAKVINMSLSGAGSNTALEDAMVYAINAGVTILVAAGNDNTQINGSSNFYSPASYGAQYQGLITVGSINAVNFLRSSFSNYSTTYVEIGSPGSNGIYSTMPNNSYANLQGTSMATPVATGVAAAIVGTLRSKGISYSAADIEHILTDGAKNNPNLNTFFKNGNQLDMPTAVELLKNEYILSIDGGVHKDFPP